MIASAVGKVTPESSPAQAADAILSHAVFHIFNNRPLGREYLLQSAYLAKQFGSPLVVYVPVAPQCLLHGNESILTLNLGSDYVRHRGTARVHVEQIIAEMGVKSFYFYQPSDFTAGALPHLPVKCFLFVVPPESRQGSPLRPWPIGRRVQSIVRRLRRPALLPTTVFRPWMRVAALVEEEAATTVIRAAMNLAKQAHVPLSIHASQQAARLPEVQELFGRDSTARICLYFDQRGRPAEYLYAIPRDSLVILSTGNRARFRDLLVPNPLTQLRALLPNPLLVVDGRTVPWS